MYKPEPKTYVNYGDLFTQAVIADSDPMPLARQYADAHYSEKHPMRTLALVATGNCPVTPEIQTNWESHVSFLLLKGKQTNKQFKVDFLEQLANALLATSVVGYLVCSVLARKFSLDKLLREGCMNTLMMDFEMNLVLTLICKALKLKEHLPMLAFYRSMIYLS